MERIHSSALAKQHPDTAIPAEQDRLVGAVHRHFKVFLDGLVMIDAQFSDATPEQIIEYLQRYSDRQTVSIVSSFILGLGIIDISDIYRIPVRDVAEQIHFARLEIYAGKIQASRGLTAVSS